MSSSSTHELDELGSSVERQTPEEQELATQIDALPPTDRGRGAYLALACCTVAQAPIWGIGRNTSR